MKEKEVNIPWFTQRTKTPRTDLHCSRRHGAPSPGALESPGRGVSSKGLLEGERERERKKDTGTQASGAGKGALMIFL